MTPAGLPTVDLITLFAGAGGLMVLFYVLRLRRRRVEVPFSPLWARVVEEKQSSSLFRALKRIFSLLVQLAIVGLIVLALGDPKSAGLGCAPTEAAAPPPVRHTLVLVDASASMATLEQGRTRLARARIEAQRVIDAARTNPNHKVMVVQLDARTRPLSLWSTQHDALTAAVAAVAPAGALDTPTDVAAGLRLARDALRGLEGGEVVFVTDRAFAPIAPEDAEGLDLKVIGVGAAADNVGVAAFNVRPYLDDSLSYAVFYSLRNDTDRDVPATLFLYANEAGRGVDDFIAPEHLVASYAVTIPAHGVATDIVDDVAFEGSRLMARLVVDPSDPTHDSFARDDVAFAIVPPRRKLRVQLVSEGNLFLHATLFVRENVDFVTVAPADYRGPEGFDLTVVDDAAVDVSRPGAYFLIHPREGGPFAIEGAVAEPQPGKVDGDHPLARNLTVVDWNILEMPKLAKARGDAVVIADKGGDPILVARRDAEGERTLVALSFDLRKSLLPMSYAFPLLVVNVLNYFYQVEDALLVPNRAGVELSLAAPHLTEALTEVRGPSDARAVYARQVGDRVQFSTDRVGIYDLLSDDPEVRETVAINLMSAAESQVAPQLADYPAWAPSAPVVTERDPWLSQLWRVLLLAALGLVVLEWLTYHRRVTV